MPPASILVTGANGFVGQHLIPALRAAFPTAHIHGTSLAGGAKLDITDTQAVQETFATLTPDICLHLAAISAIGAARSDPDHAWRVNLAGTLNIAAAIRAQTPTCRLIFVSTSEVYGATFRTGLPLDETAPLAPANLYAATKAAAEMALCAAAASDGLRLLRLRPFNHTGPGQREDFVIPSFAAQIARIEAGRAPPTLAVGNLDAERDFLDIADICAAYIAAITRFDTLPNDTVLNLAAGRTHRIGDLLQILLTLAQTPITIRQDPARLRPSDTPRAQANPTRAQTLLNWHPTRPIEQTLLSVLTAARRAATPWSTNTNE